MSGIKRVQAKKPPEEKSQRIQFRLHPDVPEEATALGILQFWKDRGYDTRYILTSALMALEAYDLPPINPSDGEAMQRFREEVLNKMQEYIQNTVKETLESVIPQMIKESLSKNAFYQSDGDRAINPTNVDVSVPSSPSDARTKQFAMNIASLIQSPMSSIGDIEDE